MHDYFENATANSARLVRNGVAVFLNASRINISQLLLRCHFDLTDKTSQYPVNRRIHWGFVYIENKVAFLDFLPYVFAVLYQATVGRTQ